ncbi:tetratricopeptide repeat protein [Colwellia sp. C1TZA3]|uniref:tetratricopeptide repeat protein n=1 Tax=Colwellia sp. C1TZA3 TaxID=2508879 RepID=UPI0011BA25F9|nr:tetratricopeptide repeat protein [Colwellia sp. C1TZA3]TWX72776.1 hypothetical protein ESZ39_07260 [Colwellia sp. C1TZA3]
MNKTILKNTLLATLLLSTSHTTLANAAIFQVAVVKGAMGTADISKGKVESGISKLIASESSKDFYDRKMNLCVAYLQSTQSNKSELACTEAIDSIKSITRQSSKVRYLTSLNYSNRGVARYKKNQLTAALEDFELAVSIDNNPITVGNLQKIKQLLPINKVEKITALSD